MIQVREVNLIASFSCLSSVLPQLPRGSSASWQNRGSSPCQPEAGKTLSRCPSCFIPGLRLDGYNSSAQGCSVGTELCDPGIRSQEKHPTHQQEGTHAWPLVMSEMEYHNLQRSPTLVTSCKLSGWGSKLLATHGPA